MVGLGQLPHAPTHTLKISQPGQPPSAKPSSISSTTKSLITCQKQYASFSNAWTFGAHQASGSSHQASSISIKTPRNQHDVVNSRSKQPWRRRTQSVREELHSEEINRYQKKRKLGTWKENSPCQKSTQTVPNCFLLSTATCSKMTARR